MSGKPFLDTNILLYAYSEDVRADRAEELLRDGGMISVQVLNEFVDISRRKLRRSWTEIDEALDQFRVLLSPPMAINVDLHDRAIALARRHGFATYDSLIMAAAIESKCETLYTEDMQHGQKIGPVTIRNPFR